MLSHNDSLRPPIGFVVEGDGEYHSYPSLASRIVAAPLNTPRVNARGCGNIVRKLEEHLNDLVITHHPCHAIVTLDLGDVLQQGVFSSCVDLRVELQNRAEAWLASAGSDPRMLPTPESVVVVLQVKTFETWLIADLVGLDQCRHTRVVDRYSGNVDDVIVNPTRWLRNQLLDGCSPKNPGHAREIISSLDPKRMRTASRSFRKFFDEVSRGYDDWLSAIADGTR